MVADVGRGPRSDRPRPSSGGHDRGRSAPGRRPDLPDGNSNIERNYAMMTITPIQREAVLDMMHWAATIVESEAGPVESREEMNDMPDEIIAYHIEFGKLVVRALIGPSLGGVTIF